MMNDSSWEYWLSKAIRNLPSGVSTGDAIKVEEILRDLVRQIETTGL